MPGIDQRISKLGDKRTQSNRKNKWRRLMSEKRQANRDNCAKETGIWGKIKARERERERIIRKV